MKPPPAADIEWDVGELTGYLGQTHAFGTSTIQGASESRPFNKERPGASRGDANEDAVSIQARYLSMEHYITEDDHHRAARRASALLRRRRSNALNGSAHRGSSGSEAVNTEAKGRRKSNN
ncbi:hypothetical protein FOL47_010874 [Perkinsus chesapeaki]|uniref:Uncharacterized protein n=1 Tax=Perkinsus chesapeaki TaxID=330153 RepID=A0A7J6MP47_PERCH|nr:hypothetical protein FOL47_010874 [Perkinsus chesapeaki]